MAEAVTLIETQPALTVPTSRRPKARPHRIWISHDDGASYDLTTRLAVEEIRWPLNEAPRALFSYRVAASAALADAELDLKQIIDLFPPKTTVGVDWEGYDHEELERPRVQFLGFLEVPHIGTGGHGEGRWFRPQIIAYGTVIDATRAQVFDFREVGFTAADGVFDSAFVTALPFAFNAEGKPNRHKTFAEVVNADKLYVPRGDLNSGLDSDHDDSIPEKRYIGLFEQDGSTKAEYWTYLQAVAYMLDLQWPYSFIDADWFWRNVWARNQKLQPVDGAAASEIADPLIRRLMLPVNAKAGFLDGLNVWQALLHMLNFIGVAVHQEFGEGLHKDGDGEIIRGWPKSFLFLSAPGSRRSFHLPLAWKYTATDTAEQTLAKNVLDQFQIVDDSAGTVNVVSAEGDTIQVEMTLTSFLPAWAATTDLAENAADSQKTALELADENYLKVDPPSDWDKKYNSAGQDFVQYTDIGRLWRMNEDGLMADDATRQNYAIKVFDVGDWPVTRPTVVDPEDPSKTIDDPEFTPWPLFVANRSRVFQECISVNAAEVPFKPHVRISLDGGTKWEPAEGLGLGVTLEKDRCGLRLSVPGKSLRHVESRIVKWADLTLPGGYTAPGGKVNVWAAIILGKFKIEVTAVVDTDYRLLQVVSLSDVHPTIGAWPQLRVIEDVSWKWRLRSIGNSILATIANPTAAPEDQALWYSGPDRDDRKRAHQAAERYLREHHITKFAANPTIPWITGEILPGDTILGFQGIDISLEIAGGDEPRFPVVAEVVLDIRGGRTTLKLEDPRLPG